MCVIYTPDNEIHADNVAGFATATIKHHVSSCLAPDELTTLVQHAIITTDTFTSLQYCEKKTYIDKMWMCTVHAIIR